MYRWITTRQTRKHEFKLFFILYSRLKVTSGWWFLNGRVTAKPTSQVRLLPEDLSLSPGLSRLWSADQLLNWIIVFRQVESRSHCVGCIKRRILDYLLASAEWAWKKPDQSSSAIHSESRSSCDFAMELSWNLFQVLYLWFFINKPSIRIVREWCD